MPKQQLHKRFTSDQVKIVLQWYEEKAERFLFIPLKYNLHLVGSEPLMELLFGHRSEKIIKNYLFTIPQHYSFGVGDYCFGFCLTPASELWINDRTFDTLNKDMKNHRTITTTKRETQRFAFLLAKKLKKAGHAKLAAVIALSGNLGSGKTTFVQGFAKGLGIKGVPKSPTFILMQPLVIGNQPLDAARGRQPTPGFSSSTFM